jgi:flagellin-like protein
MEVRKRGISPVIASVFMILLVLVLATIIFLWAKGFISEQVEKYGENIENYCERVNFEIAKYSGNLEVKNSGNVDIRSFEIEKTLGGNTEMESFPFSVDAGQAASGFIGDIKMEDGRVPDEVFIYPVLVGKVRGENRNSVYTCLDKGVKLDV